MSHMHVYKISFDELSEQIGKWQAITTAVMKGLRSFVWTVIFLLLLLYAVGVFITQSVTDFKISKLVAIFWSVQSFGLTAYRMS